MKKKEIFIIIISLIIFFEPQMFKEDIIGFTIIIDSIYKVLKLICSFLILILYFKYLKKPSKLIYSIGLLQIIMAIATIIYKGDIIRFSGPAITTIAMAMIAEILIKNKILNDTLKKINKYFCICYVINIISIILIDFTDFKEICNVYFLGIDNRFIFTFLPWIIFEGIVSYLDNNKITKRYIICFVAIEIVLVYKLSISAMLTMALFIIPILKNINLSNYKNTIFITYIVSNISLTVLNISKSIGKILKFLHKDITLSGRTYLWNGVMEEIKNSPLIGKGMKTLLNDKQFFYNSSRPHYLEFCKVSHAHNSIMTIGYRGGLLSICVYLWIFYKALEKIKKNKNNIVSRILSISLIAIGIASLFDTMDFAGLYFIFALCWNIDQIHYRDVNEECLNTQ